jgi:poly(hydroxyalkanoate) depolymerase family esterase
MKFNNDFLQQMREATQLLQRAGPTDATAAIQRALRGTSVPMTADAQNNGAKDFLNSGQISFPKESIIDAEFVDSPIVGSGEFLSASLRNQAGSRDYKIYIPSRYDKTADSTYPLIIMLHGCKQDPDDFAAGTMMNEIAEEHGCIVVYPAQTNAKNMSYCWNWFNSSDQQRDRGEPSIIADITRRVMDEYQVDRRRVYVAGLSAGGAMAAIMGQAYPDLFAAVGIHSGLAVGAASDVASAFAAMNTGASASKYHANHIPVARPIIVFQGDSDTTVHPKNAPQVLSQFAGDGVDVITQNHKTSHGCNYTKTIYRDSNGKEIAEQWLIHGAGHAWSGGSVAGSYTDPKGPCASREMLRFFLAQRSSRR